MLKKDCKSGKFLKGNLSGNVFTSDFLKGNQFAKGNASNKTSFKNGQRAGDKNNTWKGGIQIPKNDCVHLYAGVGKRVRRPRVIYESAFGKLPKGFVIYHIDRNRNNDNLYNLEAISRAELMKRNNLKNIYG
jgi:hypothetical protein